MEPRAVQKYSHTPETVTSASGVESPEVDQNPPTGAPQVFTVEQEAGASHASTNPVQVSTPVPTYVFTGTLQYTLGFATVHIKVLVEDV